MIERADYENACFRPKLSDMSDDPAEGILTVSGLLERFGLKDRWVFLGYTGELYGVSKRRLDELLGSADLFVDCGTHGAWIPYLGGDCRTVLVDGEPGMTQMRWSNLAKEGVPVPTYDCYFTNGSLLGSAECQVPSLGIKWEHVFNPVLPNLYEMTPFAPASAPYSTVMNWKSHKPFSYAGREYGQKDVMFEQFFELPTRVDASLEVAIAGEPDRERLVRNRWSMKKAAEVTSSYDAYGDYIRASRAEFSVCKEVFAAARTGWFSDRSAAYLASGRPVVVQDTGVSEVLPVGEGLMTFSDFDSAVAAIESIEADYARHAKAAREIAVEYLDGRKLMNRVVETALR